jgi:hypothetical protein
MSSSNNNASAASAANSKDSGKKEERKVIIEVNVKPGEFDLQGYIANYPGQGKIKRLLFIAEHCKTLEVDALKMAVDALKKTTNTLQYKTIAEKYTSRLGI